MLSLEISNDVNEELVKGGLKAAITGEEMRPVSKLIISGVLFQIFIFREQLHCYVLKL
jgi:hypothetical protein